MLNETHQAYIASGCITRMGRAGLEFWPDLLAGMQKKDPNSTFAKPLGILLRDAPERIGEVLELTHAPRGDLRLNAVMALGYTARQTMEKRPEVESRLLEMLASAEGDEWIACASSLGEISASGTTITALLNATRENDPVKVGRAIDSLGRIAREPERVVPRLIELLREFKEYDPDYSMYGESCRVTMALETFGMEAIPAIPHLIARLWMGPFEYYDGEGQIRERLEPDEAVVKLLGRLGPNASAALPELRQMKQEMIRRGLEELEPTEGEENPEPESFCPEYLIKAIRSIEPLRRG